MIVSATDEVGLVQAITAASTAHQGNVTGASLSVIEGYATVIAHIELGLAVVEDGDHLAVLEASVDAELALLYDSDAERQVVHRTIIDIPDLGSERVRPHNRLRRGLRCGAASGDAPGMLHLVAEGLASRRISIIDMQTRVFSINDTAECSMHFEVQLPGLPKGDVDQVVAELETDLARYFAGCGISWSGRFENLHPHPYWDGYDEPGEEALVLDA